MVVKAKAGELHLSRTIWGMRDRKGVNGGGKMCQMAA
jgi:hypothetical protein